MNRRFQFVVVAFSSAVVALLLFGAVGRSASPDAPYTNLGVYSEVLSRIKADYVEEPDMKAVTVGAINGMLESLDPHASFVLLEIVVDNLLGRIRIQSSSRGQQRSTILGNRIHIFKTSHGCQFFTSLLVTRGGRWRFEDQRIRENSRQQKSGDR